ncbi:MAG: DegT/DnrJ/EryC1/StrS family aminotransferase, partial [Pseudonocardiaceae bacterium]
SRLPHPVDLPHTDTACTQVLSLPVHPALTDMHLDHIAATVAALAQKRESMP